MKSLEDCSQLLLHDFHVLALCELFVLLCCDIKRLQGFLVLLQFRQCLYLQTERKLDM